MRDILYYSDLLYYSYVLVLDLTEVLVLVIGGKFRVLPVR